jgi:hypothetical protein
MRSCFFDEQGARRRADGFLMVPRLRGLLRLLLLALAALESLPGRTGGVAATGHQRSAAYWWKPSRATQSQDLAMIQSRAELISTLFVYCEFTVLPDGSFGVATNQSWFHASWGDRTMCTPEYLGALSGHGNAKVQLMLSMGDANITSYRKAFANPRPLISGMLEAIIAYPADIVSGWNVDWEPCNNNNNDKKNKARQQGGGAVTQNDADAFRNLLGEMRRAHAQHNRTISACVSQWCNMTSDFKAIASVVDSIQDMGSYHADSLENFVSKLNLTAGVPREKLYVGMGFGGGQMTKFHYETTKRGLEERFAALSSAGVQNIAMFELVSSARMSSWNMSSDWWSQLEQWTAAAATAAAAPPPAAV